MAGTPTPCGVASGWPARQDRNTSVASHLGTSPAITASGTRSTDQVKVQTVKGPVVDHRILSGVDFRWPLAPGLDGKPVDLARTPPGTQLLDHATTLMDPSREVEWITVLNTRSRLML